MTSENRPPLQGHITRSQGGHLFGKAIPYAVKLAALLGNTFYAHQVEQQAQQEAEQDRQYRQQQHSVNDLYPLQGTPMTSVQRYSPSQPKQLLSPQSSLGMQSIHHMAEARLRAQELSQYQQAPDFQANPASQKRMFDPYGFVPPQIAQKQNHAEGFDPLAERKARISKQGQKAQRNYDESLQRRKHLNYIEPSESEWEEITQAFHQMPVKRYQDIRKKDEVREMLIAMKEKQPFENMANIVKPLGYLIVHMQRSDQTLPYIKTLLLKRLKKAMKDLLKNPKTEANMNKSLAEITAILGTKPLMNSDPYIIIGEQAYGFDEAVQKAKEYVAYLKKYGKPLPPLPYPTTPPHQIPQGKWNAFYPDATQKFNQELAKMLKEVEPQFRNLEVVEKLNKASEFIVLNFNNNERYDFQVNHGLPGQVLLKTKDGHAFTNPSKPEYVLTQDQYALYRGVPMPAAFFSNYAYGQAVAAAGLPIEVIDVTNHGLNLFKGKGFIDDIDIVFGRMGYNDYIKIATNDLSPK